jgi:hypothetical protein
MVGRRWRLPDRGSLEKRPDHQTSEAMNMFPYGFDWTSGLVAGALLLVAIVAISALAYLASDGHSGPTRV